MIQKATVVIEPLAPFDLATSSLVFIDGNRCVRSYQNDCFSQVIDVGSRLVWARLTSNGCVNNPKLTLELYAEGLCFSEEEKLQAVSVISRIFSLDMPLESFYSHVQGDFVMARVTQMLCGFKFPTTPTVFEALIDAIVEQQISIKVARGIEERLAVMFGEAVIVGGEKFFAFPSAAALVEAGVEGIRRVGLSLRKAEYIYGVSQRVVGGFLDLEGLKGCGSKEVVDVLDGVRGIGVWTAELTLLRGMQRFDVLPADDFGLRRVISRYYCGGRSINAGEACRIADVWGEWRGLAAFYLIIAEVKNVSV
ncbi:MAG: DNA-3-methyladenine glycosylase [Nitrososphaerota archaeon]|nr:DNA-3-methyladenine glycosylase [Nitrososphaerota archaeon]